MNPDDNSNGKIIRNSDVHQLRNSVVLLRFFLTFVFLFKKEVPWAYGRMLNNNSKGDVKLVL